MTTQKKSGNLTIANIVSVVGTVLLLLFTFLGNSYLSGGELGWDILISIGITGFTVLLLCFLIKAKGAENNLTKWKIVEFATLFVYIIFSLSTSLLGGIMHFFVVNDHKDDIKEYAIQDLEKIDQMFNSYLEFESEAISITGTGLKNATKKSQVCDETLNTFMDENGIAHSQSSAENYENVQRMELVGNGFEAYYDQFKEIKNEIQNVVNSWSAISIPSKANLIDKLAKDASAELTRLSTEAKLPVITQTSSGYYTKWTIESYQRQEFEVDGGIESFQFKKALQGATGFSSTALLIVLLIHTLVLFNYIAAYRTSSVNIKNLEEDGGRIL